MNNIKKTVCMVLLVWLACIFTTACELTQPNDIQPTNELSNNDEIIVYVDPDTGVNYLIFKGSDKAGMCVRYNPDGSIMVDKDYTNEEKGTR